MSPWQWIVDSYRNFYITSISKTFPFFYWKKRRISTLIYLVVFAFPRDKTRKQKNVWKKIFFLQIEINISENLTQIFFFGNFKRKNFSRSSKIVKNLFYSVPRIWDFLKKRFWILNKITEKNNTETKSNTTIYSR